MYRAIPVGNKACAERVRKHNHEQHRKRVNAMRVQVDTREPHVCSLDHLRTNLKKEQMMEEKYYKIDRENRILLGKMSDIMKHPSYSQIRARSGPPSLNRDARKVELARITSENQNILKRIQTAQPIYNHVEWEDCAKRNQTYVKNGCEYPPCLTRRTHSRSGPLQPLPLQPRDDKRDQLLGMKDVAMASSGGPDAGGLQYVLKEGVQLGNNYYMVEMATDGRTLAISADDYEGNSHRTLELLVNEKNTRRLLREHNHDYTAIASQLRVDGDKLYLEPSTSAFEATA